MTGDAVDGGHFRRVLGNYPTGVAVITSSDDTGAPLGLTVGTFTSVSLDPALVAFLPDRKSQSWARIRPSGRFCVNILAEHQEEVCRTFARSATQKFDAIDWHPSPTGLPLLDDAVAWIECDLWSVFEAGDHDIAVGAVRALDAPSPGRPLLFFQGGYGRFTAGSMASGEAGLSPWFRLVDRARPHMEKISSELSVVVTATVVTDGEEVVVATAGGTSPRVYDLVGSRQNLIPPVGVTHMALSPDADLEQWLAPLPEDARAAMRTTVASVRERGYHRRRQSRSHRVRAVLGNRRCPHAALRPADQPERRRRRQLRGRSQPACCRVRTRWQRPDDPQRLPGEPRGRTLRRGSSSSQPAPGVHGRAHDVPGGVVDVAVRITTDQDARSAERHPWDESSPVRVAYHCEAIRSSPASRLNLGLRKKT